MQMICKKVLIYCIYKLTINKSLQKLNTSMNFKQFPMYFGGIGILNQNLIVCSLKFCDFKQYKFAQLCFSYLPN